MTQFASSHHLDDRGAGNHDLSGKQVLGLSRMKNLGDRPHRDAEVAITRSAGTLTLMEWLTTSLRTMGRSPFARGDSCPGILQ